MEAYLTKVKRLTDDLIARNLGIPKKVIAAYILNNLTPEYENAVAIISQSFRGQPGQDIDLMVLFSHLIDEARRLKDREPQEMAMLSGSNKQGSAKANKGSTSQTPQASAGQNRRCDHCNKRGHTIEKCYIKHPELKPKKEALNKTAKDETSLNTTTDETEIAMTMNTSTTPNT